MVEIPHALDLYIASYGSSTAQLNAMAGALFAGSAFLTVRVTGVIRDSDLPEFKHKWVPVIVMALSATTMLLGYFVYGQTAYFYSAVYRFDLYGQVREFSDGAYCASITNAADFFDKCIRAPSLSALVMGQISSAILSGVFMLVWFTANIGVKK